MFTAPSDFCSEMSLHAFNFLLRMAKNTEKDPGCDKAIYPLSQSQIFSGGQLVHTYVKIKLI